MKFGLAFASSIAHRRRHGARALPAGRGGRLRVAVGRRARRPADHHRLEVPVHRRRQDPGREPDTPIPDPLIWLAFAAAAAPTMRLGTCILIVPQRNPLVLAKELATLDQLSGGRVELGLGVGWMQEEFDALGVPWERRGARNDEYIAAMRALWAGPHAEFHGEFVDFPPVTCSPRPVQASIPILVGGDTEAAIQRAVRLADGYFPGEGDAERLGALIARVARPPSGPAAIRRASRSTPCSAPTWPIRSAGAEQLAELGVGRVMVPAFFFAGPGGLDRLDEFGGAGRALGRRSMNTSPWRSIQCPASTSPARSLSSPAAARDRRRHRRRRSPGPERRWWSRPATPTGSPGWPTRSPPPAAGPGRAHRRHRPGRRHRPRRPGRRRVRWAARVGEQRRRLAGAHAAQRARRGRLGRLPPREPHRGVVRVGHRRRAHDRGRQHHQRHVARRHPAVPGSGHYSAAKAGVNALTLTMSVELAPKVRVNGIAPGFVPTEVMMTALDMDVPALEKMAAGPHPDEAPGHARRHGRGRDLPGQRGGQLGHRSDPHRVGRALSAEAADPLAPRRRIWHRHGMKVDEVALP